MNTFKVIQDQMQKSNQTRNQKKEDEIYFVDRIEGTRLGENEELEFYVKWEGGPESVRTWEPAKNFTRMQDLYQERKTHLSNWNKAFREEFKDYIRKQYLYPKY